jgi:hypothetical protein
MVSAHTDYTVINSHGENMPSSPWDTPDGRPAEDIGDEGSLRRGCSRSGLPHDRRATRGGQTIRATVTNSCPETS